MFIPSVTRRSESAAQMTAVKDESLVYSCLFGNRRLRRVAPVSGFYSKHDEGAPGPSRLGTGEISNDNPSDPESDGSARVTAHSADFINIQSPLHSSSGGWDRELSRSYFQLIGQDMEFLGKQAVRGVFAQSAPRAENAGADFLKFCAPGPRIPLGGMVH